MAGVRSSGWGAIALALLIVTSVAVGVGLQPAAGASATSTTGSTATSGDATVKFAYVDQSTSNVTMVLSNGSELDMGVSATVVGKGHDMDDDPYVEVPYVTGQQTLHVIDRKGESTQLADTAEETKTKMAVADLDGDGTYAVYYARDSSTAGSELRRAYYNGTTEVVVSKDTTAMAALGVADVTGDGETEIVFVGSSTDLRYYNETGGNVVTFYTSGIGSNGGLGVGAPRDFDGDGVARVPIVDGSNNAKLVEPVGNDARVTTVVSGGVAKHPVAGVDWTGDPGVEFLYVTSGSTNTVKYATLGGETGTVTDDGGNAILTTNDAGVAWLAAGDEPLTISNYTLTNRSGTLVLSFNASEQLESTQHTVTGPDGHSFSLSDFNVSESGGTWTYNASYVPAEDGNYTAVLDSARSVDGDSPQNDHSDDATVDVRFNITNLTASAASGQDVAISFNTTEKLGSVNVEVTGPENATLGLSSFSTSDDSPPYTYTGTYDASTGGNYTVTLTKGTSQDGQVDDDNLTDTASLPDFEVYNLTLNTTADGNLTASFYATGDVASASLDLSGPENTSVGFGDFTETSTSPYRYETTVNVSTDGNYTLTLSSATSTKDRTWDGTLTDDATLNERYPAVVNATLVDATDHNGVVNASDRVTVTANVSGDVERVTADLSAFGAGTVTLSQVDGDTYRATVPVDGGADGPHSVQVTAHDGEGSDATATTNEVVLDTTPPTVTLGDDRTATVGESLSFSPTSASDETTRIVAYHWAFGDGTSASGSSVSHSYDGTGTYAVTLTVADAAGNTASAVLNVSVTASTATTTPTPTVTSAETVTPTATAVETATPTVSDLAATDTPSGTTTESAGTATGSPRAAAGTDSATPSETPAGTVPESTETRGPGLTALSAVVALVAALGLRRLRAD